VPTGKQIKTKKNKTNKQKTFVLDFIFNCSAGWGYIAAFTNILAIYQLYHT
jgi:hypothetical protein